MKILYPKRLERPKAKTWGHMKFRWKNGEPYVKIIFDDGSSCVMGPAFIYDAAESYLTEIIRKGLKGMKNATKKRK